MATFALSDIHGHYEIYEKVKAMLKPEDIVYFLGDAGDRGPDSWKCQTGQFSMSSGKGIQSEFMQTGYLGE